MKRSILWLSLALCLFLTLSHAALAEDVLSAPVELAVPEDGATELSGPAAQADEAGAAVLPAEGGIPVDAEHFTDSEDGHDFLSYVRDNIDANGDGVLSEEERLAVTEIRFGFDDGPEALDGLQYFPNLEVLNVNQRGHKPGLSRLDVSRNTKLKWLGVNWNSLESLDLSHNTALEELCYYRGGVAETLDLSACTALKVVDCDRNICLKNLILGDKPNLEKLECEECSLTELELSGCPNLITCYCSGNALTKLNINGCTRLRTLDCQYNPALKELDICDCIDTLKTFRHNADLLVIVQRPVEPVSIDACTIGAIKAQTYTGEAWKPAVTVKYKTSTLDKDKDYTVAYKNNTKVGTATVTVTGIGDYAGTRKLTFAINPKAPGLTSLSAGSGKLTVKWKKVSGVTGYQIQYGTRSDFSNAKKVTVTGSSTVKKTLKSLKSTKKYYVRVRACKKVSGKYYYSAWSKKLSKKTK